MSIKSIKAKWLRFSEKVGNFNARIILTILYFTVFLIPALISKFKHNMYGQEPKWEDMDITSNIEEAREQW